MKKRLVELLVCPECKKELKLEVFKEDKEIEEGLLRCDGCDTNYPIINGIPRLLIISLLPELRRYHKEFFKKYNDKFSKIKKFLDKGDSVLEGTKRTLKSYSYQWRTFDEMLKEWQIYFDDYMHPFKPDFFKNKLVLDVGCGYGRIAYYSAKYGAEVVAMDLSEAVESAYKNTRDFDKCHVVQGSIYDIPFKKKFDFIYNVGVIQHLPKKEEGFVKLTEQMRENSTLYVWVYSKRKGIYNLIYPLRLFTTRMPFKMLKGVCLFCASLQYLLVLLPYRLMMKTPLRKFAKKMQYTNYANYPFKYNYADWFDRLSVPLTGGFDKEEVENWFKKNGLKNIKVFPRNTGWRGVGEK